MIGTGNDLHDIVKQYLHRVTPSGSNNIMALCPFHVKLDGSLEKTPSFAMSLVTGLWFCHSCQSKGNLYTFLRDVGVDRPQIEFRYRFLIDEVAKNIPAKSDPLRPKVFSTDPIPEAAMGLLDYCPTDLLHEGFTEETLKHFGVGFDMVHMRITYPLRDLAGNLVGVSGRAVTDGGPRYKIYDTEYEDWGLPARLHWDKRSVLWHSYLIYPQIYFMTMPDYVVVVEGFKACMWLWQAGIKNVVALLGTYLSEEQKWILERMGAPVYLFLDNNEPGKVGTQKTADKLRRSLKVHVVEYPERLRDDEDAQPDSCAAEEVVEQVGNAKNYFAWKAQKGTGPCHSEKIEIS